MQRRSQNVKANLPIKGIYRRKRVLQNITVEKSRLTHTKKQKISTEYEVSERTDEEVNFYEPCSRVFKTDWPKLR